MSTTLLFLVPMGLLAVAASLCFVGCGYPNFQFDTYTQIILGETSLIAYWPLNEPMGSTTAVDLTGHGHNGTYTHPPAYPAFSAPGATSPAIPNPTLVQGQASIVKGDGAISANSDGDDGGDLNYNPACVDFEGDYVSIPWSTQTSVDLTKFTLEAWVEPGWSASDLPASHVVFDTRTPNFTGFGLYVDDQNNWSVSIGNGTVFTEYESNQPIVFGSSSYVAVTCDSSGTVNLWVNPLSATPAPTKRPFQTATTPRSIRASRWRSSLAPASLLNRREQRITGQAVLCFPSMARFKTPRCMTTCFATTISNRISKTEPGCRTQPSRHCLTVPGAHGA
jgi:Concanavalin A-like lectin/glucanases superfamily